MYSRIILKLSGELLSGGKGFGIDPEALRSAVTEIKEVFDAGIQIGLVIGGGNIFRGRSLIRDLDFPEPKAHHMGMTATVINGLALETALRKIGCKAKNFSSFEIPGISEKFDLDRVLEAMTDSVVIFTGGTGNPFFSTDTAASLRAAETDAEVLVKATKVDGVYSADPNKDPHAVRFDEMTYGDYVSKNLKVMDISAVNMCREKSIPVVVFDFSVKGNLASLLLKGETAHTLIR